MYRSFSDIPDIMTFNEARAVLKVGKNTMLDLLHKGYIDAFRIKNRWRITRYALIEYLKGL